MTTYRERVKGKMEKDFTPELRERAKDIMSRHGFKTLGFTLVPRPDDLDLLDRHGASVLAYRDFMIDVVHPHTDDSDYTWDETHFADFSVGFLCAKGVPPSDAFGLSIFLRYNLQDFDMEAS